MNMLKRILVFAVAAPILLAGVMVKAQTLPTVGALRLNLYQNHEDTSVQIQIDMTKLKYSDYLSLGVFCVKENDKTDFPAKNFSPMCGNVLNRVENKIYTTVVSNLSPNSKYEFCLSGINTKAQSTGFFECSTIVTKPKKSSIALVYINYDVSDVTRKLIKRYKDAVAFSNPDVTFVEYAPTQKISSTDLLNRIKTTYKGINLKYLVMIGFDLPIPMMQDSLYLADQFRHLSVDESVMQKDFIYTLNTEITISAIRPESEQEMQNYFNRLHTFYTGDLKFDRKLFIADAMIPTDSTVASIPIPDRYKSTVVDSVGGIVKYHNPVDTAVIDWQTKFGALLGKSHEITIINAHGATQFHEPCRFNAANNEEGCISSSFIKRFKPNSEFVIGISCNIGNFMTKGSPMNAYVFSGNSLVGLGAEVPLWDQNGQIARDVLRRVSEGFSVGDVSRLYGLVVIGDPFLKIGMVQNYGRVAVEGIKSVTPVYGAPSTKITLTLSNPNKIQVTANDFNFGPYGLSNYTNVNNETITFTVPWDAKAGYYDVVWFGPTATYKTGFNVTTQNVFGPFNPFQVFNKYLESNIFSALIELISVSSNLR